MGSIRRNMLIPVIGSGFTRNCNALSGKVPSGTDYKAHMLEKIGACDGVSVQEMEDLKTRSFSEISGVYHDLVQKEERLSFLRQHFTHVSIEERKRSFLSIAWPYVYTLNIDDGIERNSEYNQIIYANRKTRKNIFDEEKCLIKLHGDITEMLSYEDSVSEVFDQSQYVRSLRENNALLSRLSNDLQYQNVIFVGCSLDDEIDILDASRQPLEIGCARYFCTVSRPSLIQQTRLRKYGISHCIVFDSYDEIYELLCDVADEANQIGYSEIDRFLISNIEQLKADFDINKAYLFFGKSLIDRNKGCVLPYFFISRDITTEIIENIPKSPIQLVVGNSCCGKTYVAVDVIRRIRDRDIFMFESKDSLSNGALDAILNRGNCLMIADTGSLTIAQIEQLLKSQSRLTSKKIHVILIANKNSRDLTSLIRLLEVQGLLQQDAIPVAVVSSQLNANETERLNKLLVECTLSLFTKGKSLIDNIITASEEALEKNRFSKLVPNFSNDRMLACLIALAIERKIYSLQMIEYDLDRELTTQQKATHPLIEQEATWSFESSPANNSPMKYILNAEYWLNKQLDDFAQNPQNHETIISAFYFLVSRIVLVYNKPDLMKGEQYYQYKPFILFDNINKIFPCNGLSFAQRIYDRLSSLLSEDPHYMHQRAKCQIKIAKHEKETEIKIQELEKAYRFATLARDTFQQRYNEWQNEKIMISVAHAEYTMALILCHLCKQKEYMDALLNTKATTLLLRALSSPHNSYAFAKTDAYNYGNAISKLISKLISNTSLVDKNALPALAKLFQIISGQ